MSSYDRYVTAVPKDTWDVPTAADTRFTWEYDDGRDRLLSLYQKGKDKQWDAQLRIDWDQEVDPYNVVGLPDSFNPLVGSEIWDKMSEAERLEFGRHQGSWLFSQFLHGEQGALNVSARIVQSVPDLDSKFYAATQTMDEARHVELYARFVHEKIGMYYPVNQDLAQLLKESLDDSRWDLPYLGMQVLIEGLALAAFGLYRDMATTPLVKQLLAYVMQDEARHVAFGRLALKDFYAELSSKERAEREEFVVEGCYLMRDRFTSREVFETLDMPVAQCLEYVQNSEMFSLYQSHLFSRIVPCVKDIGLWGDNVQKAYADMGVLDNAKADLTALMRQDEEVAEAHDREREERELAVRQTEVADAIALGSE
ncbi:ferritin-like domain-containing protein [Thermomonospora umbrina]|uniref:Ribonucleotide reductase beta subunit family protein with ferritin-like domain n=1 Tax=Thermomonospora umbrina TaxID=111806 RepID=A0A3D9SSV5_9ACTN|nr:ferritin-like domain-containing protein [Thermomonospora umbrina]REE97560.1 ribonucleotide reductase beta subunit family protein with ferritin-like domain [Thermomonospora umbrina]